MKEREMSHWPLKRRAQSIIRTIRHQQLFLLYTAFHYFVQGYASSQTEYQHPDCKGSCGGNEGISIRASCKTFKVKRSTVGKYKKRGELSHLPRGRRPMLYQNAEELLVQMLIRHSQRGIPLTQRHVVEGIRSMLQDMTAEQHNTLKIDNFEKHTPSPSYLIAFPIRHCSVLKFWRPSQQGREALSWC